MKKKVCIIVAIALIVLASITVVCVLLLGNDHEHNMTKHERKEATCTEAGTKEYWSCDECHNNYADEQGNEILEDITIPKLGHNMTKHEKKDATCTEAGSKEYWSCDRCHKNYADEKGNELLEDITIPKLEHHMTKHEKKDATYTEAGTKQYWSCDECHNNYADEQGNELLEDITIPMLHHMTKHEKKDATCTEAGTKEYWSCDECHNNYADEQGNELLEDITIPKLNHHMTKHEKKDATCTEAGSKEYWSCDKCHKNYADEQGNELLENTTIPKLEHDYDENGKCNNCGDPNGPKKGNPVWDGDKVEFGEYPQSKVTESGTIMQLNIQSGNRPSSGNNQEWTDYGYYKEGKVQSYMWYIDISFSGARYRGVYFTSYRPNLTDKSGSASNSQQDENGYYVNEVYWFKYEPISWRVLKNEGGTALLMADIILDSQQYYHDWDETRNIGGKTVYSNNYKESDIRAWLNKQFYETAFTSYQQSLIQTTLVDNSAASTGYSSNKYACENTNDKVFLLSLKEITTSSYGFNSNYSNYDTARRLKSTDYAKSQGVWVDTSSSYKGNGRWWLRSPYNNSGRYARGVIDDGDASLSRNVSTSYGGVVPALQIRV